MEPIGIDDMIASLRGSLQTHLCILDAVAGRSHCQRRTDVMRPKAKLTMAAAAPINILLSCGIFAINMAAEAKSMPGWTSERESFILHTNHLLPKLSKYENFVKSNHIVKTDVNFYFLRI